MTVTFMCSLFVPCALGWVEKVFFFFFLEKSVSGLVRKEVILFQITIEKI